MNISLFHFQTVGLTCTLFSLNLFTWLHCLFDVEMLSRFSSTCRIHAHWVIVVICTNVIVTDGNICFYLFLFHIYPIHCTLIIPSTLLSLKKYVHVWLSEYCTTTICKSPACTSIVTPLFVGSAYWNGTIDKSKVVKFEMLTL